MTTKRGRLILGGAALAVVCLSVGASIRTSPANSEPGGGAIDDGAELLPFAAISLDEAIAAAQTAAEGRIGEIDLEYVKGRLVFNVDVGDRDV